jgi:predicted 3-demethylubiquinone-9 3-methyltransferase (glyoxalase superfamily)
MADAVRESERLPPFGQDFTALNGGPVFKFNEAISFQVHCKTQEELDHYWERLSAGGDKDAQRCGWLKDRYGVSWQIVPTALAEMLQDQDAERSQRVMRAMLQMDKLDLRRLQEAYGQK